MSQITVELVTPAQVAFAEDAHMVVAPGILGEFGALAGHAPFISQLKPGVIRLYSNDSTISHRFIVTEGFAEVNGGKCIILCEKAYNVDDFNKTAIQDELTAARDAEKYAETEVERHAQGRKAKTLARVLEIYAQQ